jgi:hypothetical protein
MSASPISLLSPRFMMFLRCFQPTTNDIHIYGWRLNSRFRFLLKRVENIDRTGASQCINGPVSIARVVLDNLQNSGATKSFQDFGMWVLDASLCLPQSESNRPANLWRKFPQIVLARSYPIEWLAVMRISGTHDAQFWHVEDCCQSGLDRREFRSIRLLKTDAFIMHRVFHA